MSLKKKSALAQHAYQFGVPVDGDTIGGSSGAFFPADVATADLTVRFLELERAALEARWGMAMVAGLLATANLLAELGAHVCTVVFAEIIV
jgi:hypothetical protein